MLGAAPLIAFVATSRPDEARAFYVDVLGLRLVADEPFALIFDAGGTALRIAKVQTVTSVPYTVLGWEVADVRAAIRTLVARGVTFARYDGLPQDDLGIWMTPAGAKVAWFQDPDGNVLSLTQR